MRPVDPSIAAFGEKCAGVFWKDMPVHHNIATEMSVLNGGKNDPETILSVLPAKRTQEPRLLTRLFSSPRGHYNTVRGALDYHGIQDPHYRAYVGGEVLKELWPKIYKPLEKKPDFNRPTDLFEHFYVELAKKKKKKPAKEKTAASRWREPENLVKIVQPQYPTKRLKLLQEAAAKIDPERKQPGGEYETFLDSLKWHDIPEQVISRSERVTSHLSKPKYLFRGIVPGDNIRDPLRDHGTRKPFIHATPYPDEAAVYTDPNGSWPKGKSQRVQAYQVFRPRPQQPYVSDFMLDQTTGKTPPNSDWNLALRDSIRKAVQLRNLEEVNGRQSPRSALPRLREFMRDRTYETPVTSENRRLGTFLTRDKPNATLRDQSLRKDMQQVQMARIPQAQKGKFEGMARQWQTFITPEGKIKKHVPQSAKMDSNDSRLRQFEMEWRPKHLMTSPKVQKQIDEMLQKIKARERRADKPAAKPSQPKKREPVGSKKANWLSDYGYHFNKLYNPESYGFDVRTPTGRDDIRNIAVSTAVGTGIGALRGAIWPGYVEKLDEAGRVISKKKRGRLLGSLRDAMLSGALSGVSSAAGITAKKYMPEIEQALIKAKENIVNKLPVQSRVRYEGVDTSQPMLDRAQGAV